MAKRPIFIPDLISFSVKKKEIEFSWNPGFSIPQKQKNILELHKNSESQGICPVLEISTKSLEPIGRNLSAFNLKIKLKSNVNISVEAAFQGSKIFQSGGPFTDLFYLSGKQIKNDSRIKNSGKLLGFSLEGEHWELNPTTSFYDWLYINALNQNKDLSKKLFKYAGFSDIEFNPKKQINCQASAAALYISLFKRGVLKELLSSKDKYLNYLKHHSVTSSSATKSNFQTQLFNK